MAFNQRKKITGTMPHRHHPDDAQWIDEQLSMFDYGMRAQVASAYADVYGEAEDMEPVEHRKAGIARRTANTRLRNFVNKHRNN